MKQYYFLFAVLFWGCSKDVILPDHNSLSLVLYPYLEVNQPIKIFAYSSVSVYDTGTVRLKNPTALIFEEGRCVDTVHLNQSGEGISKIAPREKIHYKIQVSAEKYKTAETEVCMPSALSDVSVDTSSFSEPGKGLLTITFVDDASTSDYYCIMIAEKIYRKYPSNRFTINSSSFWCESEFVDFYNYAGGELALTDEPKKLLETFNRKQNYFGQWYVQGGPVYASDKLFNGKKVSFKILASRFYIFNLSTEEQLRIAVAKITPDYYMGLYSQAKYNSNKIQDLPITEPITIFNSVKNGHGFAAASATLIDSSLSNQKYKDFFSK